MLVLAVAEDFNKLFENRRMTPVTPLGESGRIVIVTVYIAFMFVVGVLSTKDSWADGTGEVLDMVFAIQSCDVGASQSTTTLMAEEVQSSKVISLTQWVLATAVFGVDGEELGSNDFSAVL
jgi:hypothetical protein